MKTSGNAISLAPLSAASSIRAMVLLIEASRSSQVGAACTTATLYFGCAIPIAWLSLLRVAARTAPRSRPLLTLATIRARLPGNENSTAAAIEGRPARYLLHGRRPNRSRCQGRRTDADPVHHGG